MSAVQALLEQLNALDIKLWLDGANLRVNAPKGALTPELRAALSEQKPQLIAWFEHYQATANSNAAIQPSPRTTPLPLSFGQERLWFLDQLEGQSTAYNLSGCFEIQGAFKPELLARALQLSLERHEILRTSFPTVAGQPIQQVHPTPNLSELPLEIADYSSAAAPRQQALQYLREQALAGFDLSNGPLLRVVVVQLGAEQAMLLVVMHHTIADGWSMGCLIHELTTSYQAFAQATRPQFPALPIQYGDFAAWQRDPAQAPLWQKQVQFWHDTLLGAPALLELPSDYPRPSSQSWRGKTCHFALSACLSQQIRHVGQRYGCTPYMTLLAGFAFWLARMTGSHDLPIGTPIANRNRLETEHLIGFFVNSLVMRIKPDRNLPFSALLRQTQAVSLAAFANQDAPFAQVVEALQPERTLGYNPIFQVMFDLQTAPTSSLQLPNLSFEPCLLDELGEGTAMFDLSWTMQDLASGFTGQVEFATDLFAPSTIERWIEDFEQTLSYVCAAPEHPLYSLPISRLADWGFQAPISAAQPIHHLVQQHALVQPNALAVTWQGQHLSYAQLDQAANRLAHYLIEQGIGCGDFVGLCFERSLAMPVAWLGVLKAGAAYLPLDPSYPLERLAFMCSDAKLRLVLTQAGLADCLPLEQPLVIWEQLSDALGDYPATALGVAIHPQQPAYVIYTSGSTGLPKGTVIAHGPLAQTYRAWEQAYQLSDKIRVHLQMAAFSFDVCTGDFVRALGSGGRLVLCPRDYLLSPADLYQLIVSEQVDCGEFVPAVLRELCHYLALTKQKLAMPLVIAGSDMWYGEEYQRFQTVFEPSTRLINSYGVTEAVIDSCYFSADQPLIAERSVPIGRPFAATAMYVLDQWLQPVPNGAIGELYLAGERLASAYLGRPDLTSERFVPDPWGRLAGARMYRTGDRARWTSTGQLEFLGRGDQQIKLRGFRIELGEIETALTQYSSIQHAVALVHTTPHPQLVAYVVTTQALDQPALLQWLQTRVPEYMLPSGIVELEQLPLTPNGKVDRKALLGLKPTQLSATEQIAPEGATEQALAAIWQQVLGQPVGRHANFFGLGGDSILAMQVVSRCRAAGLGLTPRLLFQHQTIAALAQVLPTLEATSTIQQPARAPQQLLPVQHWFRELAAPNPHHYNQSVLIELTTALDPERLQASLNQLTQLHPSLRLACDAQFQQKLHAAEPTLHVLKLDPAQPAAAQITAYAAQRQQQLHLHQAPLWHASYLQQNEQAWLLLIAHHWIIDGVSWRILLEDLAYLLNEQQPLPASTSVAEWTEYLQQQTSQQFFSQLGYWQQTIQQLKPLVASQNQQLNNVVGQTLRYQHTLSPQLTANLLGELHQAYRTTIDDLLLAALVLSYCEWSGEQGLSLERESHGRFGDQADLDLTRTVGWLTSIYPQHVSLPANPTLAESIIAVKEQLRAVPDQGLSYGGLRYQHPDPTVRQALTLNQPLAVTFNYLGQLDQGTLTAPFKRLAEIDLGDEQDPATPRSSIIEINGYINNGVLTLNWEYCRDWAAATMLEQWASSFASTLEALVEHCRTMQQPRLTPSDVPYAQLNQRELDGLALRVKQPIADIYRLTPLQEGMLFHSLLAPEQQFYIEQVACRLDGTIDPGLFEQAWQQVVERHAVFRTAFYNDGLKHPCQVVAAQANFQLCYHDWSVEQIESNQLNDVAQADRQRGFDLQQAPLMRISLIKLAEQHYHCIWTHHHLLLDGWSVPLVLGEVVECYQNLIAGSQPNLAPAPAYREYLGWLQAQDQRQAQQFWRDYLATQEQPTALPCDYTGLHQASQTWAKVQMQLTSAETQALSQFARDQHVTLSTLAQAAWGYVLGRYSSQLQVLFGLTVAGRPANLPAAEHMVGMFINTLPCVVPLNPEQSVGAWLQTLQQQQLEAQQYAASSLVDIQSWSTIAQPTPLFESILVFENYPSKQADDQQTSLQISEIQATEQTNYPLTLVVAPAEQLVCSLSYANERFDSALIEAVLTGFCQTLMALTRQTTLAQLPTLGMQHQQLAAWNATEQPLSPYCLHELFQQQAQRTPQNIAIITADQRLSYAELEQQSNQIAHYLCGLGVGPNSLVGIHLERSALMLVALLGVLKAGGAYVPLDPSFPLERLSYMAEDSNIRVLLTATSTQALASSLQHGPWAVVALDEVADSLARMPTTAPLPSAQTHDLAYAIYTSGSTGKPKGVLLEHQAVVNFVQSIQHKPGIASSDRLLAVTTLSFDIAVLELYGPLLCGATVVLASREAAGDAEQLINLINQHDITTMQATPATWRMLLAAGWQGSNLRALCGGEPLPRDLAGALLERVAQVWNMYGPTETCVWSTCAQITTELLLNSTQLPIGRPLANTQCYVLDAQQQPLPVGALGELYIAGTGVARGYHERPELTEQRFVPDPFSHNPTARMYRTGDLARYRNDGTLECLGRIDQQVKIRGYRIELGEIETILLAHPSVAQALVVVQTTATDAQLIAYLIGATPEVAIEPLRQHLALQLPRYMLPSAIVVLNEWPLTPNGKIDRQALPKPWSEQPNQQIARDPLELQLQQLWTSVLGHQLGIHDHFLEHGGHSLIAIRFMALLNPTLEQPLPLTSLYQAPTIAEMAQLLRHQSRQWSPLVPLRHGAAEQTPLFLLPGAGGNVLYLQQLAQAIPTERAIYAVQAYGLEPNQTPLETVEAMAQQAWQAIRHAYPQGPYTLIGHSFGSDVAWAIASLALAEGQQICQFFSLDSAAPQTRQQPRQLEPWSEWMRRGKQVLEQAFAVNLVLTEADLAELSPLEQSGLLTDQLITLGILPAQTEPSLIERFLKVFQANHQASFQPAQGLAVPVVLIKARDEAPEPSLDQQPDWGWSNLTSLALEIVSLPGDHHTMLHEPYVQALGRLIGVGLEVAV
ncbi:amino acid adenylation domain [Herpetosiphon aurantiacus DSM 785]|uniref:Amino acid adenylation domain n=3 Tax=Herpetosiphon TaxID=64 RepID=A9B7X6_HERA2|nr:amino acid adenylation domain [Herpetosiphon aurantiacus DSM 785]